MRNPWAKHEVLEKILTKREFMLNTRKILSIKHIMMKKVFDSQRIYSRQVGQKKARHNVLSGQIVGGITE